MLIELEGVEFKNKGSELMLRTIIQEVGNGISEADFALRPRSDRPFVKRAELALYQKLEFRKLGIDWGNLGGCIIPPWLRQHFGVVLEREVDVLLDASGLGYSEKWGINPVKKAAHKYKSIKGNGGQIIMLPQAFGPFKNPAFSKYLNIMIENADLIYARDQISYEYLTEIVGLDSKIKISPDFTNLIEPTLTEKAENKENSICIIPNYRMIDKTNEEVSANYVPFMKSIVEELRNRGEEVFMLIHEGDKDLDLAKTIIGKNTIDIVKVEDPLIVKGIISNSKGVISSRFHGLVSALSTGIPALATGWSHKYKLLFKDYSFEDGMLKINMPQTEMNNRLDFLTDKDKNKRLSNLLRSKSDQIKQDSHNMFSEVIDLIQS